MLHRHHRTRLLVAAIASLVIALPAGSTPGQAPPTQLYIDVATHTMPGMPAMGGLGRMAMGMFGGHGGGTAYGMTRFPALPGQYLDIALHNGLNPGVEATQQIPTGLRLGEALPLVPNQPLPKGESSPTMPNGKMADGTAKILIYWGCGTAVRPGQPKVITFSSKDGKFAASGSMQGRYVADRSASTGPENALWPNQRSHRNVPDGASLVGEHHVVGDKVPESLKFALDQGQDFLPKIALTSSGDLAAGQTWRWSPVARARGYFLAATGMQGDALVLWSSSETPDAGMGLVDYLPNATVDKWIKDKVLLAPGVTSCAMPKGIFAASGNQGAGGMLQMIAYGPESYLSWPPKPANPKTPWTPEWNVRVRSKSTALAMLGLQLSGEEAAATPTQPPEKPVNKLLRGLFGH
jgi:hypothetical protein